MRMHALPLHTHTLHTHYLCALVHLSDVYDFIAAINQVTFPIAADSTTQCTSYSIVDDDIAAEGEETFKAVIENTPFGVSVGVLGRTDITITDDDGIGSSHILHC